MASLQSNPLFYQIAVTNADESQITGITVGNVTATSNLTSTGNTTITGNLAAGNLSATKLTLAGTSNISIGGGVSGQHLATNGAGGLSWVTPTTATGTVTSVATATNNGGVSGFTLTGGPITSSGTLTLNTPSVATLRSGLNIGNVANMSFGTDTQTFLRNDGQWATPPINNNGNPITGVTSVSGVGSGLDFSLSGTVTSSGSLTLTVPDAATLRTNLGLGNIALQNFNGSATQFLRGDGTWQTVSPGTPITGVTSVGVQGAGALGFTLATSTGTAITGAGNIILNGPSATSLRESLTIGNVANANFNGSSSQVLYGNGQWALPTGTGLPGYPAINNSTTQYLRGDGTWQTLGNITATNLNGSSTTVLYGNGAWAALPPAPTQLTAGNNISIVSGAINMDTLKFAKEKITVLTSPITSYTIDVLISSIVYNTAVATSAMNLNIRGNFSTSLNSMLAIGETITVTAMITNGATALDMASVNIDGTTRTVKYISGSNATGIANTITAYTYTIIKTADNVFTVLCSKAAYK